MDAAYCHHARWLCGSSMLPATPPSLALLPFEGREVSFLFPTDSSIIGPFWWLTKHLWIHPGPNSGLPRDYYQKLLITSLSSPLSQVRTIVRRGCLYPGMVGRPTNFLDQGNFNKIQNPKSKIPWGPFMWCSCHQTAGEQAIKYRCKQKCKTYWDQSRIWTNEQVWLANQPCDLQRHWVSSLL